MIAELLCLCNWITVLLWNLISWIKFATLMQQNMFIDIYPLISCAKFASIDCLTFTIIFRDRLKNCKMICFWFVFNIRNRFINRIENESKTNQKRIKTSVSNQKRIIWSYRINVGSLLFFDSVLIRFDSFWIRFWFV